MNWYKIAFPAPKDVQYVADYNETEGTKELAHKFKIGDDDAITTMAREMASRITDDAILVPAPSRTGKATTSLTLAEKIRDIRGGNVRIEDVVTGNSRESLYNLKKQNMPIPEDFFGYKISHVPQGNVYIVDNVYHTGKTAESIKQLIPHAQILVYAYSEPKVAKNMNWYKKAQEKQISEQEITQQLDQLIDALKNQYPGLDLYGWYSHNTYIEIATIKVPPEMRNQGIGHKVMQQIKDFAQSINKPVVVRPEPEPRKKQKLMNFYKDLDFVHNKGRRSDNELSTPFAPTMYWRP